MTTDYATTRHQPNSGRLADLSASSSCVILVIRDRSLVMAYLDQFLSVIVKHGGSDLHFAEAQPPKMRVHGDIMPIRASQFHVRKP